MIKGVKFVNEFRIIQVVTSGITSTVLWLIGGWDNVLIILLSLIVLDYCTGLCVSILGKSEKTPHGGLDSKVGFNGIVKKVCIIFCVILGTILDRVSNLNVIRNAVIVFFTINESLSIVENLGNCGVPIPGVIKKKLEQLKEDSDAKA